MKPSAKQPQTSLFQKLIWLLLISLCCCTGPERVEEEDQFSMHIRTSEPRTPEEERQGFTLPEGFEIELFASEPDIGKPMNISFDPKGRLWVTQSNEYPFYDSVGTGPDRISILEDTDGDGQADKIEVFADSLNIPIGITPVVDGAIAYSIPNVYHFVDHDGDDRSDERRILLSGFEYKDTHGMVNNFFRGLDGWIHADHGFANVSKVVGTDGGEPLVMQSGNTFRFRPDGTGVQFTTTGRVNPFGYAMDEYGYMYSVDCHSSPIYQLIRGADYPHFGKKPTGIGFGPYMMRHEYGSTALAGLEYYTGDQFPKEFQQSFYLGDVVKCRVYRSTIKMDGTTPVPTWEPDFIVSEDPWFRPVDVKLGPDGALYIADFYNSIIGHYEVPLDHPDRDRQRGRIWRVTYKEKRQDHKSTDWTKADLQGLVAGLKTPVMNIRMMVADQIVDRFGKSAVPVITDMVNDHMVDTHSLIHGMWILFRLEALSDEILSKGLAHADEKAQVHTLRILFELPDVNPELLEISKSLLVKNNPHLTRAVAMLLARYPRRTQVETFVGLKHSTNQDDTHLYYALRQGLRDHLRNQDILAFVSEQDWEEEDSRAIADALMGVDNSLAASFLHRHIQAFDEPFDTHLKYTTHISRHLPNPQLDDLVSTLKLAAGEDMDKAYQSYLAMKKGLEQAGRDIRGESKSWSVELATLFLKEIPSGEDWQTVPLSDNYKSNPWFYEEMDTQDGQSMLISGPRRGRGATLSQLRSPTFNLPENISFTLAGHKSVSDDGGEAEAVTNKVELFLSGQEDPILTKSITNPDQSEVVSWNPGAHTGKPGYLVVTDGSAASGEFVGIGDLSEGMPQLPNQSPTQQVERHLFASNTVGELKIASQQSRLQSLLQSTQADILARTAAAEALLRISADYLPIVGDLVRTSHSNEVLQSRLISSLGELQTAGSMETLATLLDTLSFELQKEAGLIMSNSTNGIEKLFDAARDLVISPKLLLDPKIDERLQVQMSNEQREFLVELTKDLSPFSEEVNKLIEDRVESFPSEVVSLTKGEAIFSQHCAVCHQINDQGGNIGPQLDGIGSWGLQALSEKILDPNRNISKAFVNYRIELTDGKMAQGLYRRDEGKMKIFADVSGNEFSYPADKIKSLEALPFTLMPDNFGAAIAEGHYYHLMSYLLNQD